MDKELDDLEELDELEELEELDDIEELDPSTGDDAQQVFYGRAELGSLEDALAGDDGL